MYLADQKLVDLTNKFLKEFLDACHEIDKENGREKRDDLMAFHFTLAETLGRSDYPRYEEEVSILMGMSSFDDAISQTGEGGSFYLVLWQ